jgi:2-deoxy-D-gluconate 3-dehydrogenase
VVSFRLDGHRVLVTGAGRGLGSAIARGLVDLGATVYGTSRDPDVARRIGEQLGTTPQVLDVGDVGSFDAFVSRLEREGGVDMLVNNAGVNIPAPATEVTPEDWDTVLDTNLKGTFFLSTALARTWLDHGVPGSIVNIASQAGIVAIEERASYGASKAALIHLTKVLALEWAGKGIRVNAVAPTFIRTELTASTLDRQDWADELLRRIPIGRFGEPEDVVGAVAYLLGNSASLVTGHTIVVDGGYSIR